MAGFPQPKPLGFLDGGAAPDGINPGAGGALPSSVGMGAGPVTGSLDVRGAGVLGEQSREESIDLTFPVDTDLYRLRPPGALWHSIYYEEPIRLEESLSILARAVEQHSGDDPLVRLLTFATTRMSSIVSESSLVLLRLRLREQRSAPRPYTPPPSRPAPAPAAPPAQEPVMPPAIAAAQAAALKEAAGLGVPFCEECARAAAREAAMASAS